MSNSFVGSGRVIPEEGSAGRGRGIRVRDPWLWAVMASEFIHHMGYEGVKFSGEGVSELDA